MKYNELKTHKNKSSNRVGRGISAGQGKTAGRGTKGQGARTGSTKKPGFAGGSNPLMQKLPKLPGFKSHKIKPEVIYTGQLESFANTAVDAVSLADAGLISNPYVKVKLIVKGELSSKVSLQLTGASQPAIAMVEKAGGSYSKVARLQRAKTRKDKASKER
jgi:large subunit ribosomal protein L15